MSMYLNLILAGIFTGGLYALLAIGQTLIFGVLRFINVAHGDMLTVGAFAAIAAGMVLSGHAVATVPIAFAAAAIIGIGVASVAILRLSKNGEIDPDRGIVFSLGLSMVIGSVILTAFGPLYRAVPGSHPLPTFQILDVTVEGQRLLVLVGSVLLTVLLFLFLRFTLTGKAIRATAENAPAAQANGINITRMQIISFALGSGLAGAAGALVGPITYAYPAMGFSYTIYAFIVVVIGGLGSLWGALAAAYLLGIAESLSVVLLPSGFNAAVGPLMMVAVMLFRPQGLFGRGQRIV